MEITAEELASLEVLRESIWGLTDMGPEGEGWCSDELEKAKETLDAIIERGRNTPIT